MKSRLFSLDIFLDRFSALWRPQPFKEIRPNWCTQFPDLCEALLGLSDADVVGFERDNGALLLFLSRFLPEMGGLNDLCTLPRSGESAKVLNEATYGWKVPGRKKQQIEAFSRSIDDKHLPLLEWCGGKGHLGRTLGLLWQQPVETVEWNAELCKEGKRLSERAGVVQTFHVEDALLASTAIRCCKKHVLALHACGDLHRQLIQTAGSVGANAIDLSPCCYHLGCNDQYVAFNKDLSLQLSRDDRRLSVTNSGTAAPAQVTLRNREMAWKLGFDLLRREFQSDGEYKNISPVDKSWLKLSFKHFVDQLAMREGVNISREVDWDVLEVEAWQRQADVMRLNLLRFAFRRAIEIWLVFDIATYLEGKGYIVSVSEFCPASITPRNILISARL